MLLSVVVPVYNESDGIEIFHKSLISYLNPKNDIDDYELIYVNDGSSDDSIDKISKLAQSNKKIKVLCFSRNFGKEMATTAGIGASTGDAVILLDADGQHPPRLIKEFVKKWKNGIQVVIGVRSSNQKEGTVKKYGSKIFYKLFNTTSGSQIVPGSTDFRLIDAAVRDELVKFTERHRITRGLIDWLGFKRDYIEFDAPARIAGTASYKTSQLVKLAFNSFISLSLKPLFFFGWVGVGITAISVLTGVFIIIEQLLLGDPLALHFTGTAMLGILMSFLVGLVLISQSLLATYISHIHTQTQGRPMYVVDVTHSINL